jgi:glutathione S-transferase
MKLYVSLTSPFARKVRVALEEKHLADRIETVLVDPWNDDGTLAAVNPLLQVPTLARDDGLAITNSDTIMNWLDRAYPEPGLWPQDPDARFRAEAVAALAQTVIEYAVFLVIESRRPESQRSAHMIERRRQGIVDTAAALNDGFHASQEQFNLDSIGVACALAYVDFRHPQLDWRSRAPKLDAWMKWALQRPSMKATAPPA